jgi:hypothetical protein
MFRIRDPVPFLPPLVPGLQVKNQGSGSGMKSRIMSESFWVKIRDFFDENPESGMEQIRIRDKHPGSATLSTTEQLLFVLFLF